MRIGIEMDANEYFQHTIIAIMGGLVSGISILLYLDLEKQNPQTAIWGTILGGFLYFIIFFGIGWALVNQKNKKD